MPSPGHHWWDETRRERAALWSHVFMDLCTRVANGQNPSHRVRSRRRASLRGDRFVELSAHKPLGRQPCCVAMSPGALVFHGSSRERESLLGADTMLLFVPGYRIRDPGLRLSFPAHVATDRVDGDCRAHKRPVQLVIMHALLRAAMRAVTRSVQLTRPSR